MNGQTEVVNRTLGALLRALLSTNLRRWEECLAFVEFAYNRTIHSATQKSPFEVVYGRNPITPLDMVPYTLRDPMDKMADDHAAFIKRLHQSTRLKIEAKTAQYTRQANKGRREVIFEPGDLVWIHLRKERFPTQRDSKLKPRSDGPFQVLKRINNNAYQVKLPGEYSVHDVFNVADLSPFVVGDDDDLEEQAD